MYKFASQANIGSVIKQHSPSTFLTNQIIVTYNDGSEKTFEMPVTVEQIIEGVFKKEYFPIVGAIINNEVRGLNDFYDLNVRTLEPVYLNTPDGQYLYDYLMCVLVKILIFFF
jgi:hypothetical protein